MHTHAHIHNIYIVLFVTNNTMLARVDTSFQCNKYVPFFQVLFDFYSFFSSCCMYASLFFSYLHRSWGFSLLTAAVAVLFDFRYSFRARLPIEHKSNRIDSIQKKTYSISVDLFYLFLLALFECVCACLSVWECVCVCVLFNHNNSSIVIQFSFKLLNRNAKKIDYGLQKLIEP